MNYEREHTHATSAITPTADLDVAPGRASRTDGLIGPTGVMPSGLLMRKAERDANHVAANAEDAVGAAAASSGSGLPDDLRSRFEGSLATDLSGVRVHTGAASAEAAAAVGARAYTLGNDIHFGAGHYDPSSHDGQHLIAHEVAHTVQQAGAAPHRQNKLEVSTPGDAHEVEADRAAAAMVGGQPASVASAGGLARKVIQRDFFSPPPQSGGPSLFPVAPQPNQALAQLMAPNVDGNGVPYTVPGSNWAAGIKPIPLPLDQAMPSATIPMPAEIPGWRAPIPPHETQIGAFKTTDPGDPNYVVTKHSPMIKSAWDYYRFHVCQDVQSTWNNSVSAINSFTQAANTSGNDSIETLLKDMKPASKWDMTANAKGKGSMADQANASSAKSTDGAGSVADVAKGVGAATDVPSPKLDKSTDFTKSLDATGAAGGPVQDQIQRVQTAHEHYVAHLGKCEGTAQQLEGAADTLKAAGLGLKAKELDEKKEGLEQQKKDIESGKASIAKVSPLLAQIFVDCKDIYEKLNKFVETSKIKGVVENIEKENYAGAAKEAATGVLAIIKMEKLEALDAQIAATVAEKKSALDQATVSTYDGAQKAFKGLLATMKTMAGEADTFARDERNEMKKLADVVKANWKGKSGDPKKDAEQAKLAAGAIRGLPIANKILSLVLEVRKNVAAKLPPTSGFNSEMAHTLATKGVGAPGDAELVTTGGWILGIQPSIDGEVEKWQGIVGQLQVVVSHLGLQL